MNDHFHGFHYQKNAQGIVTITMDMDGPVNAMNAQFRAAIAETVNRLEAETDLAGVIITSAKSTFFAGGDLAELSRVTRDQAEEQFLLIDQGIKAPLRRLEKLPVPVVAAINGAALGGGLEICLACNYRVAIDSNTMQLGLPEVTLGLLPGAGGMVRLIHRLGAEKALPLVLEGSRLNATQALEARLIDAVVDNQEELLAAATAYIESHPNDCAQPWDQKGHRITGGDIWSPKINQLLSAAPFQVFQKTKGLLPAPEVILSVAANILATDFDSGMKAETRGLIELTLTPEAKNIINTLFFQMNAVKGKKFRPKTEPTAPVKQVAVVGSNDAAQYLSEACAKAGIEVYDCDLSQVDSAAIGCCNVILVADGRTGESLETLISDEAIVVYLNPTQSGEASPSNGEYEDRAVGLQLIAPYGSQPVVELHCGEKTSERTLSAAFDFARQLRKTPIIINSGHGSFLSRVAASYVDEGQRLQSEGLNLTLINNAGQQIGMPQGPLAGNQDVQDKGIADKSTETQHSSQPIAFQDVKDRLLFRQVIEALNCFEKGMLRTVAESNVAGILSQGAPTWTGGYLQFVNTCGLQAFKQRCESLSQQFGERFSVPEIIEDKLRSQQLITD